MDSVYSPSHADKKSSIQNWLRIGVFSLVVLCVGAIVGSALTVKGWSPFKGSSDNAPLVLPDAQPRVNQSLTLNTGFSAVAKAVTPAVVVIRTKSRVNPQQQSPFFNPFENLIPDDEEDGFPQPRRRVPQPAPNAPKGKGKGQLVPTGTGSGVIVTPDGYILTNNHVVDGADKVEVELADKRILQAKVIGTDPPSDIAVIKLDATGLPTVPLGDSNLAEVGDIVLAVGNPLGVGQTVTMGIISAKSRSTSVGGNRNYEDFIQTDAPINRGNSGGALVSLKGELVGIPSQILSPSGGSIGIGFAIPTNMAKKVMEQLVATGKVKRGLLGVSIQPVSVDPDTAEGLGYKGNQGVIVQSVEPGLSADKAGVKPGDIILEFEGKKVEDSNQLRNMVSNIAPGTTVKFKIWRDGVEREMSASLVEAEALKTVASNGPGEGNSGESGLGEGVLSGVKVDNITSDMAQRLNMASNLKGVVVSGVDEDSSAAGRLRRGDVIQSVNRQPVTTVAEFSAAVKKAGNKKVLLYVQQQRGGVWQGGYVTVSED